MELSCYKMVIEKKKLQVNLPRDWIFKQHGGREKKLLIPSGIDCFKEYISSRSFCHLLLQGKLKDLNYFPLTELVAKEIPWDSWNWVVIESHALPRERILGI